MSKLLNYISLLTQREKDKNIELELRTFVLKNRVCTNVLILS